MVPQIRLAKRSGGVTQVVRCGWFSPGRVSGLAIAFHLLTVLVSGARAASLELFEYMVEVAPDNPEGEGVRKSLRFVVLWDKSPPLRATWVLDDEDPRGLPWQERFGKCQVPDGPHAGIYGPHLKLAWEGAEYQIPVLVSGPSGGGRPDVGQTWQVESLQHEVVRQATVGGVSGWVINVRGRIGQKRLVTVEADSGAILEMQEAFFIGQGKRHELVLRLLHRQALEPNVVSAWQEAVKRFEQWSQQRSVPEFADASDWPGPWRRLAQIAMRQAAHAQSRQQGLEHARRKALTQKLPKLHLESVAGKLPVPDELHRSVVVFHFWDYRDSPLQEPYGQVGYLDFLYRKYAGQGLQIIGMVTNASAESATGRRVAAVSARKFATFMNLAYPVAQDGGELLRQLGDPRMYDGPLPLFVVVDRSGKVIHYRSGYYEVDAQRGLVELEQVIREALRTEP